MTVNVIYHLRVMRIKKIQELKKINMPTAKIWSQGLGSSGIPMNNLRKPGLKEDLRKIDKNLLSVNTV